MNRLHLILLAACLGILTTGCSSTSLYAMGQGWQLNECNKMADAQQRSRCTASANMSPEEYQRQRDAARGAPAARP